MDGYYVLKKATTGQKATNIFYLQSVYIDLLLLGYKKC